MIKKKKIIFSSILITVTCLVVFFIQPIISFSISSILNRYSKKQLGSEISFRDFELKNKQLILKDVRILSDKKHKVGITQVDVSLEFKLFKPRVIADIYCFNPHITLYKNQKSSLKLSSKKSKFFTSFFHIKNAVCNLVDNEKICKQIHFNFSKTTPSISKLEFFFPDAFNKRVTIEINKIDRMDTYSCHFNEIESSNINDIVSFFEIDYFSDVKGIINGIVVFDLERKKISRLFSNLEFQNFSFYNPQSGLKFAFNNLRIEGSYPDKCLSECFVLNMLKFPFLKETKLRMNFEDLTVLTPKKSIFSNINGSFSYNPNLGSKFYIAGKIQNEKTFDFQVNSKAYLTSSFSNWLDIDFNFDDNDTQIALNAKEVNDYYNLHLSFQNIKSHIFQAFQDLFSKLYDKLENFQFIEGNLSFSLDGRFDQKGLNKVFITDLLFKDFDFQNQKVKGNIARLEGKSSFDLKDLNVWDKFFSDVKLKGASLNINKIKLKEINGKICALDGVFQSSFLSCFINEAQAKANIKGKINEFNFLLESKGELQESEDSFASVISCIRKNNKYYLSGNVHISDSQEAVFGLDLDNIFVLNGQYFKENIIKGWIRAEKIILNKWPKIFDLDLDIEGIANIAAFYSKNNLQLQIKGQDLRYNSPYINLEIEKIGNLNDFIFEGDNSIKADIKNETLTCFVPSFKGRCYLPKFDAIFDLNDAKIQVENNVLQAQIHSVSDNVSLNGEVSFDFSKKYPLLIVDVNNFYSDIASMQKLLAHFDYVNQIKLAGKVTGCSKIFTYFDEETKVFYGIDFFFDNISYQINETSNISKFSAKANYTSDDVLTFSDLKCDLVLKDKSYLVSCPVLQKSPQELDVDLRIEKDIFDILRIKGKFLRQNDKYHFQVDKNATHTFNQKLKQLDILLDENLNIDRLKILANINSFAFLSELQLLIDLGTFPINNLNLLSSIKTKHSGNLDLSLLLDDNKNFSFEILSKDFTIFDNKLKNLIIKGKKSKTSLEIQKLNFDDFETSCFIDLDNNSMKVRDCIFKKKEALFFKMDGSYVQDESTFNTNISDIKIDLKKIRPLITKYINLPSESIEGYLKGSGICSINLPYEKNKFNFSFDLDFDASNLTIEKVRLYNSGLMNINFSLDRGLLIQGLDFSFYSKEIDLSYLSCKLGGIVYNSEQKKWLFKETNLYVPKSLFSSIAKIEKIAPFFQFLKLEDDVDLTCDIEFLSDLSNIEIIAKNASFSMNSKIHKLKDLYLLQKGKYCYLKFDYLHKKNYYTIENDLNFNKKIVARTSFLEKNIHPQPLNIKWIVDENQQLQIKELVGYFCGIDFLMQEDIDSFYSNNLFGSIKIDNSKLKTILPKSIEKIMSHYFIGKGYEISGRLKLDFSKNKYFSFEGLFSGKDFEMLGFQFKTMFSKIQITPEKVHFSDFKISDQAGILTINDLIFQKENSKWQLEIPFLKIKDLRPSLMQKINEPLGEITPLLVRELQLYDFKGDLSDKKSFTGSGHLQFINSFKRGHSVFDFPADVLSRIVGIDQELLTPVKGRVEFKVKDAKFSLSELTDSFSEGQRSKFFFILDKGKKPYIDFDGNIYINIAMKQYVLFKLTESFVISIRGNLDNPQCNLKKKRGFLN